MNKNLKWRLLTIAAVIGICIYSFYPPQEKLKLGLDLQGGIHMTLQVVTADAVNAEVDQAGERTVSELREKGITVTSKRLEEGKLEIACTAADRKPEVDAYLEGNYSNVWDIRGSNLEGQTVWTLAMKPSFVRSTQEQTVRQALETIRQRVDALGVREPVLQIYGSSESTVADQIIVELPGVDDPGRIKEIIQSTAQLTMNLVPPDKGGPFATREAALQAYNGSIPYDMVMLPYAGRDSDEQQPNSGIQYMVVRKAASITGQHLKTARRSTDRFGKAQVEFFMTAEGARVTGRVTEANIGRQMAIVLDNRVMSAPVIQGKFSESALITSATFTMQSAEDLALILRSGALPASINIIGENTVGPSLGYDSIRQGIIASLVGLALVVIAMLIYYKLSGFNAIFALAVNLLLLLGAMGYFGAVLTLPGIAGVILTVGMGVDSNVLIFERMKEELRAGKTVKTAIDQAFGRVFWTIFDTHLTTLISAAFLFQFGTGPIRGFAVTLAVGLIANMFTSIFISRTVFEMIYGNRQATKLSI